MKIPDYEVRKIAELTGIPEDQVRRVLAYLKMTEAEREERAELAKRREDHDL